jgi:hypothetical protein
MPAMRAVATATLESPTAAITATIGTAIWATVGTVGAPIGASAASAETAAIAAAVASAALRALETGTRIGANAGKIFARRAGIARTASFAGQKDGVVFNDGFDGGAVRRHRS